MRLDLRPRPGVTRADLRRRAAGSAAQLIARCVMYVFLISVSYVLLYPLLYAFSQAFRTVDDVYNANVIWIPTRLTLDNFRTLWAGIDYPRLFANSLVICLGSALLQVAVCALTGYGMARFKFREKWLWTVVLLLTVVLPPQIVSIPNFFLYKNFDPFGLLALIERTAGIRIELRLLDTFGVYLLPAALGQGMRSGIFVLIFRQFFLGLPQELEDAAYVDGAGPIRTFARIMLPNCRAAVVVSFLFSLVWYWNDTYTGSMYTEQLETISVRLSLIQSDITTLGLQVDGMTQAIYVQAGVLISVMPPLLLYLVCQRVFVESVERAGIVG